MDMHKLMEQNPKKRDLDVLHCREVTIGGLPLAKYWRSNHMLRHDKPELSLSQARADGCQVAKSGDNAQNPSMSLPGIPRQRTARIPVTVFQASLFIELEKLDWGSVLDNKSDGHAR
jgi:hypothetical protein